MSKDRINGLRSQCSYFNSAKNKLDDAISKLGNIEDNLSNKSKFKSTRINDICNTVNETIDSLKKSRSLVKSSIGSLNSKIKKLEAEQAEV